MQIDPLLSLLIGALGAALLGLLGAWIQSFREHARWVREQRLRTYGDFIRAIGRVNAGADARSSETIREISDALGAVRLVGPEKLWLEAASYTTRWINSVHAREARNRSESPFTSTEEDARIAAESDELAALVKDFVKGARKRLRMNR